MKLEEKYLIVLSRGPTWKQMSGGETIFRFWPQLYLRREDSIEYEPAWMTDEQGESPYDITVRVKIVTAKLANEPDLIMAFSLALHA